MLCIQDGSHLNCTGLAQCVGLGSIGTNQTGARSPGLHLHSTPAMTTAGLPLGVLGAQCATPVVRDQDDDRPSSKVPIAEKKAFACIQGLRECVEVSKCTSLPVGRAPSRSVGHARLAANLRPGL